MKVKYVGPHRPGVDVGNLAFGWHGFVPAGETVELPDELAKSLLDQGDEHWEKVTEKKAAHRGGKE